MVDLIGAWDLISSVTYRDGVGKPSFGDPPSGQIQYTADGRMSAILLDPKWLANPTAIPDSFTEFFAYAGRWKLEGDKVRHWVDFASVPERVGSQFVRTVKVISDSRIQLVTEPDKSNSGHVYHVELIWDRVAAKTGA